MIDTGRLKHWIGMWKSLVCLVLRWLFCRVTVHIYDTNPTKSSAVDKIVVRASSQQEIPVGVLLVPLQSLPCTRSDRDQETVAIVIHSPRCRF